MCRAGRARCSASRQVPRPYRGNKIDRQALDKALALDGSLDS